MNKAFKEYIKIDGADTIISNVAQMSEEFDGAITNTHIIAEHEKEKYHEIAKAKALSLALLEDIQTLNGFFIKREITEEEVVRKVGRLRAVKVTVAPKRKRGRPRKTEIKKRLKLLKRGLRR